MRQLIVLMLLLVPKAAVCGGNYYLSARLEENGVALGSVEAKISVGDEVEFTRSGERDASFTVKLMRRDDNTYCLGINAEVMGDWGRGNASTACMPIELGVPVDYDVVDEGMLHVHVRK